jgi:molybdate transport system ATP-binding protein
LKSYLADLAVPSVLVTHDRRDAATLGRRIAVIEAGRVTQFGTWPALQAEPATPFVKQFVAPKLGDLGDP